jgi:pantoate kinase
MYEPEGNGKEGNKVTEELEVVGSQLVERVQELVRQGNARRLIVRGSDGKVWLDTPLTLGAGLGGALALAGGLPIAALAAIAAVFTKVRVEIVREVGDGDIIEYNDRERIEITGEEGDNV